MSAFITGHRHLGVEPVCRVLDASVSAFYACTKREPSIRSQRDDALKIEIKRVHENNRDVYGARKVWHQLKRDGKSVARCTVERLMKELGLRGATRGKRYITTVPDVTAVRPDDLVDREFSAAAPNQL